MHAHEFHIPYFLGVGIDLMYKPQKYIQKVKVELQRGQIECAMCQMTVKRYQENKWCWISQFVKEKVPFCYNSIIQ